MDVDGKCVGGCGDGNFVREGAMETGLLPWFALYCYPANKVDF